MLAVAACGCGLRSLRGRPLFGASCIQVAPLAQGGAASLATPLAEALALRLGTAGLVGAACAGAGATLGGTLQLQPAGDRATSRRIYIGRFDATLRDQNDQLRWQAVIEAEQDALPATGTAAALIDEGSGELARQRLAEQLAEATWQALSTAGYGP